MYKVFGRLYKSAFYKHKPDQWPTSFPFNDQIPYVQYNGVYYKMFNFLQIYQVKTS